MKTLLLPLFLILVFSTIVLSQPTITSFTPTSGPIGTSVTISGTGFSSTPANNIVYFGATRATVTVATATQLTVTVPTGATYQPITVLVNGLVAYSKLPFSTTYPGWGVVDATSFLPKVDFATGSAPYSVAIGDLDGDGKADLAVANFTSSTISVFRNTGTPGAVSYAAKIDFATGSNPRSVAIGDLDGDGKADLAVANGGSNMISVFRNTGTPGAISYAVKIDFATGANPYSVAIGDLDGDGKADLAVANSGSNTISVFRNTGAPGAISYAAKIDFATDSAPYSVAIGDLDGDGRADLAVPNHASSKISVFRNSGTPGAISYATKIDFATGSYPFSIAIGDLDGDGRADLAVMNGSNTLSTFRNTGTPGAISYAAKIDFAIGNSTSVAIGDLDGDGKADLVVANNNINGTLSVFRNTGTPGTISYAAKIDFVTGANPYSVAIGDLDGDGKADLAVANLNNNTLSVLRHEPKLSQTITFNPLTNKMVGDAPFTLTASSSSGLPISYTSNNTNIATVTGNTVTIVGNGYLLITASQPGNSIYLPASAVQQLVFVGPLPQIASFNPTGGPVGTSVTISGIGFSSTPANNIVYFGATRATVTAASATQLTVTVPIGATYQPIAVLVNGLVAYSKLPFLTTYPGWGKVDATSFLPKLDFATGSHPYSVSIGDLDGDGRADLAVANSNSNTLSVFRNTGTPGAISYAAKIDFATGANPYSVAIGDVDGDGKPDLAVSNYSSNTISLFRNIGTPGAISYAAKIDFATGSNPYSVSIGDLDGDGRADLAVANYNNNTLSVFRNTGTPGAISYAAKIDFATGANPSSVAIGDLDGDGRADLAVPNHFGNTISVFRNTGTPGTVSYAAKTDLAAGYRPFSIAIGDLDGDGRADLAVANGSNMTSVFRNTGTPGAISYAAIIDFATGSSTSIAIGDLDGDGKADLAVTNPGSNTLSVLHNTGTPGAIGYAAKIDFATGSYPFSVAIGDLDGDGKADLAVANYSSNTVSVLRHEPKLSQTITFSPLPNKIAGDAPFTLTASSSTGLPITYTSSNTTVATVSGNTVTIVGRGYTSITASQAGNSTYAPASQVQQLLFVGPLPQITNFTPTSGPVGTAVTISGTGFNSTPAANIVYFGATRATVTAATATQLTVTVPVGATYQPITVTVNGLVAYSKFPFSTTYPGWGKVDATSFLPKVDFATGTQPFTFAIGDLDGDGKADLAVPNSNSRTISVFRNMGTPGTISYAAKIDFEIGYGSNTVAIGDLDGDGKADLAVTNRGSNTISVLRNTGTPGTIGYAAKIDFATGSEPTSVSIGDLDGDGKADLAVTNWGSTISVLRNTGTLGAISYAAKVDYATGTSPRSVAIGDLDGDGRADMAVANSINSNTVSVFRNTGTPGAISYAAKVDYATGTSPWSVAIGDLDGDGKADLAVANNNINGTLSVFRNTGTPGTISYAAKIDFVTGGYSYPISVAIGDLDGDGKADLAVSNSNQHTVSVFRNTGTSGAISYAAKIDFATGTNPYSVAIGDLDGDGKADLAVANWGSNTLSVLRHESIASQTITFNPLPSACINTTINLTATASSGLAITYTSSNPALASVAGNVVTTLAAGTVTITASQAGNGTYSPATATQSLIVNPLPTATISASGPTTFCQGGSVTLNASSGSSYLWSTGATTQSITVGIAGNYTVRVTNVNGCSATSAATTVTVNALPIATITASGATSFCPGGSVTLTASSGASYLWSTGATTQSITTGAAGNYSVTVTNNGCSSTSAATTVTINPLPIDGTIAASTNSICLGQSVTISSSGGVGTPYYYASTDGGNSWNAFFQGYVGSYSFNYTPTQVGTYRFHLRNGTSCGQCWQIGTCTTYPYVDVVVKPRPIDGTITASATSICLGQSVTISSSGGTGTPYYWASTNGGSSWNVFAGQYAGQSSFGFTPTAAGTYRFHLRNQTACGFCWDSGNNGCPTFPFVDVVVNAIPSVYIAGDGATFCSGSSTSLTAVSSAPYFSWSTGASGTQLSTVNVFSAGTYSVTAYQNGCSSTAQATVYEQYCDPNPDPCAMYGICPCFDQFCPRKETPAGSEPSDDPNVSELSVFPNPAMAQVTVALPARVEVDTPVRFFDLLGRQQGNVNIPKGQWKVSVSLDQAAEGTYIIKVGQSGKSIKLIVKR